MLATLETQIRGQDFKRWRKSLDFSQKEAANALGLKRRVVQYYEKGERDGKEIDIPKSVRLACLAIVQGATDYHGPDAHASGKGKRKGKGKGKNRAGHEKSAKHGKGVERKQASESAKSAKRRDRAQAALAKGDKPARDKR